MTKWKNAIHAGKFEWIGDSRFNLLWYRRLDKQFKPIIGNIHHPIDVFCRARLGEQSSGSSAN